MFGFWGFFTLSICLEWQWLPSTSLLFPRRSASPSLVHQPILQFCLVLQGPQYDYISVTTGSTLDLLCRDFVLAGRDLNKYWSPSCFVYCVNHLYLISEIKCLFREYVLWAAENLTDIDAKRTTYF